MRLGLLILISLPFYSYAQNIPDFIINQFPELTQHTQKVITPRTPTDEYLLIADKTDFWDNTMEEWIKTDSVEYLYLENGKRASNLSLKHDGNNWNNNTRTIYTYLMDTLIESVTYEQWDGVEWQADHRSLYTYDQSANRLSNTNQYWYNDNWHSGSSEIISYYPDSDLPQTVLTQWTITLEEGLENESLKEYLEYNNNDQALLYTIQSWNYSTDNWNAKNYYSLTYNIEGNITHIFQEVDSGNNFEPIKQIFYTYDIENRLVEKLYQEYNTENNQWNNTQRETYQYSGEYDYTRIYEKFDLDLSEWWIYLQADFYFTEEGDISYYKYQLGTPEELSNYYDASFTYYEEHGLVKNLSDRLWDEEQSEWIHDAHVTYYYEMLLSDNEEQSYIGQDALEFFPNPASDYLTIKIDNQKYGDYELSASLYNSRGNKIKTFSLKDTTTLSLLGLPPGSYLLRVENEYAFTVKKLVIH